ncbi:MAG: hypothetical protein ACXWCZ_06880 [Flavisolibacter sp.]
MKEKQFDPAGNNEKSPAPGLASVNTFNEGEEPNEKVNEEPNQKDLQDQKISKPASEQKD